MVSKSGVRLVSVGDAVGAADVLKRLSKARRDWTVDYGDNACLGDTQTDAVVLDLSGLSGMLQLDRFGGFVHVEPGCTLGNLEVRLTEEGYTLGCIPTQWWTPGVPP